MKGTVPTLGKPTDISDFDESGGEDLQELYRAMLSLTENNDSEQNISIHLDFWARTCASIMNKSSLSNQVIAMPISSGLSLPKGFRALLSKADQHDVIKLIIERMPVPDDKTSWEKIFEFKSNPDNIGRMAGLRG